MKCLVLYSLALLTCPLFAANSVGPIEAYFGPRGGCTEAIVRELNAATKMICVQARSFTSQEIAVALVEAHKRGVHVEVILDKSQRTERGTMADLVSQAGIPTFIDDKHAIADNSVLVIDESTVLTGSFNYTKNAEEQNAENLLVLRDSALAQKYLTNWNAHLEHSVSYEKPKSADQIPKPRPPRQQ